VSSNVLEFEDLTDQLVCQPADHYLTWCRYPLQPSGQVGRFACDRLRLRYGLTDQIANDDLPRGDADSSPKRNVIIQFERCHRRDDIQSRAHCPFCLFLMRLRPAEVGEHTVAQELGHVAFVPGDGASHRVLITTHHLAQVFGIEPTRKFRRAD